MRHLTAASLPDVLDCEFYCLMDMAFLWLLPYLEVKSPPPPWPRWVSVSVNVNTGRRNATRNPAIERECFREGWKDLSYADITPTWLHSLNARISPSSSCRTCGDNGLPRAAGMDHVQAHTQSRGKHTHTWLANICQTTWTQRKQPNRCVHICQVLAELPHHDWERMVLMVAIAHLCIQMIFNSSNDNIWGYFHGIYQLTRVRTTVRTSGCYSYIYSMFVDRRDFNNIGAKPKVLIWKNNLE